MMQLSISANDCYGSMGNALNGIGFLAVGAGVTCVVDRALCAIARRCFGLDRVSTTGKVLECSIKLLSVAAGITVTCLIAPKAALVELTARKALEILAPGLVAAALFRILRKKPTASVVVFKSGFGKPIASIDSKKPLRPTFASGVSNNASVLALSVFGSMAAIGYVGSPALVGIGIVGTIIGSLKINKNISPYTRIERRL
jgi:hypothetical protein